MSQPARIDPRGLRFGAAVTAVVVAAAIVTVGPAPAVALGLVIFQLVVFGVGGFYRLTASPYAAVYARSVRPRIGPPRQLEDAAPPAFAQVVGAVLLSAALVSLVFSVPVGAYIALSFALLAALLSASVGLCLGCELYLVLRRLQTSKVQPTPPTAGPPASKYGGTP